MWMGMTARLIAQHFGALGERVSDAIANFNPDTATDVERERLAAMLRATTQTLAQARAALDQEQADVANLRTLIANDEQATGKLDERLAAGTISEATVRRFRDRLEANKARLPWEMQQQTDARGCMDALQKVIDALSMRPGAVFL